MSRHYRLIGMNKLTKHKKGLKERIRREKDIYLNENSEITSVRKDLEEFGVLDPTFKWHRNYGEYWFSHISYGDKDSEYPFWCEIVHIKDWKDKEDKRRWGE